MTLVSGLQIADAMNSIAFKGAHRIRGNDPKIVLPRALV
jgi:hypothetical protein